MLESFVRFSLAHRLLVILILVGVCGLGIHSLTVLPIDAVPDITNNQVQVNTEYPVLAAFEIEKQVTFPLETALAGIPGLQETRSLSRNGFSQITAIFDEHVDKYFARQQVSERLLEAKESLPEGAEPRMGPISTGLGEVFMWAIEFTHPDGKGAPVAPGLPGWQADGSYTTPEGNSLRTAVERAAYLREIQDWIIAPQLRTVRGVAGIDSIGGYEKHFVVEAIPAKLQAVGISFSDVVSALKRNNSSVGAGFIEADGESFAVRASSLLVNTEDIANSAIVTTAGVPVRVRDVATIAIGKELRTGSASINGQEAVIGTALMLIGENSRTVAASVEKKLASVVRTLPPDVQAVPVLNRTKLVEATVATVQKSLLEGAALVIAVLLALLGNLRAAVITALAIPLSMLITAIGMVQSRISGNLMSLGAIDFGLIVDGAVIIVENSLRRLAERQHELGRTLSSSERNSEVFRSTKEMIQPTVFGQAIIITVYIPVLTLSGVEGKMFNPMAATVIFALLGAFILSLTVVPVFVSLFIRGKVKEDEVFFIRFMKRLYEPTVRAALAARYFVVCAASAFFLFSIWVFAQLGQEFVPTLDEKDLAMHAMRIPSIGITQSTEMQLQIERALKKVPEIQTVFSKTGTAEMASDPMPPNVSDTFIILKDRTSWPNPNAPKSEIIEHISAALSGLLGNSYEFTQPIQMRFNELISGVRSDVAIKVFGDEFEPLEHTAGQIAAILRTVRGGEDIKVEQVSGLPFLNITVRPAALGQYGLSAEEVLAVVSAAVRGEEAGVIRQGDRRFDIVVRLPESERNRVEAIAGLPIPIHSTYGERENGADSMLAPRFVPLRAVADIEAIEGPNQISRENGKRRIVVQANVRGRDLGSFVSEAQEKIASSVAVPSGYWLSWGGQFENLAKARERLLLVVPCCLVLIFALLYFSFDSFRLALLVFSGIPLALPGGVLALWLRDMPFSISAAVGFIALSGVAVLNGLVMVSFINQLRADGRPVSNAVIEGAVIRLRPVLMTALVASLGFIPMALAHGTGAEVQRPLATVVVGGLITSTLLTLVVLPALYRLVVGESNK